MADLREFESVIEDPVYYLAAFGFRNPMLVWALSQGALQDLGEARGPVQSDVPMWNRRTLKALPKRPRLQRRRVL